MEWQSIDTAPKDGTRVDLWLVKLSTNGRRGHDERRAPDCYWDRRQERWRSKWRTGDAHGEYPAVEKHYEPVAWMPSPPPPA
jgi:hypothetical protein